MTGQETKDNIGTLFGDNDHFTNCVVLTSDGKPCPNDIDQGLSGYCNKHWFGKISPIDEPKRLQEWKYKINEIRKCETCNLDFPLMVLAEHQSDCLEKQDR